MKFLIDAQLPKKLVSIFHNLKQEAIHTLDLPRKNATQDQEINELSCQYNYIVVTREIESSALRRIHKNEDTTQS